MKKLTRSDIANYEKRSEEIKKELDSYFVALSKVPDENDLPHYLFKDRIEELQNELADTLFECAKRMGIKELSVNKRELISEKDVRFEEDPGWHGWPAVWSLAEALNMRGCGNADQAFISNKCLHVDPMYKARYYLPDYLYGHKFNPETREIIGKADCLYAR